MNDINETYVESLFFFRENIHFYKHQQKNFEYFVDVYIKDYSDDEVKTIKNFENTLREEKILSAPFIYRIEQYNKYYSIYRIYLCDSSSESSRIFSEVNDLNGFNEFINFNLNLLIDKLDIYFPQDAYIKEFVLKYKGM